MYKLIGCCHRLLLHFATLVIMSYDLHIGETEEPIAVYIVLLERIFNSRKYTGIKAHTTICLHHPFTHPEVFFNSQLNSADL